MVIFDGIFYWFVDGGFNGLIDGSFDGFDRGSVEGFIVSFSTGSSGATAVPLRVYVASAESNCLVTDGAPLFARV
jgi:hypothetical protein